MLSKNKPTPTLKKTFLRYFFWVTLVAWLVISISSYWSTLHEIDELYDGEMAQIAHVLLGIYDNQPFDPQAGTRITSSPFEGNDNYEKKLVFQIWSGQGNLLMRSANAPLEPLATKLGTFQDKELLNTKIRTVSIPGPEARLVVHVGQNLEIRHENATEILQTLFYILLFSFPILMCFINFGLNRGTRSLNGLSEKIAHRTENDLSPIKAEDVPLEIKGMVDALNKLMSKVSTALGRERQFISDAAHELRTPLAGIKAQAQLALKDKGREQASLTRIVQGVDRTTRLANQLLTLSGVDAMDRLDKPDNIDLKMLIENVVQDLQTDITKQSIHLSTQFDTTRQLAGNEDLLYILFRNILDNAIRYSPASGAVKIRQQFTEHQQIVSIVDQGPGIPKDQHQRVFDRFYRNIDSQSEGSGLGLAIANKIAALHQAEIIFNAGESNKGLSVTVVFKANFEKTE